MLKSKQRHAYGPTLRSTTCATQVLVLLACFLRVVIAQELPDGRILMNQAEAAVKKYRSIQFDIDRTFEVTALGKRSTLRDRVSVAFVRPGKLRIESSGQVWNKLLVSDNNATWVYNFEGKTQWKTPAAMDLAVSVVGVGLPMQPGAASVSMSAVTVGQEVIEVAGQRHDCWIVQNSADDLFTNGFSLRDPVWNLWIDKKLGLVLQSTLSGGAESNGPASHIEIKAVKTLLELDAPVPDSRFAMVDPAGTENFLPVGNLGSEEDEFVEWDLRWDKAPPLDWTKLEGKAVLLVFGTTSCKPCRQSMSVLEKLYQEYKGQGLEIIQINEEADRPVLQELANTLHVSYQVVWAEPGQQIGFTVFGYPTFVMISRDRKIVANDTGFADDVGDYSEAALRSILAQAGIGHSPNLDPRRRRVAKRIKKD